MLSRKFHYTALNEEGQLVTGTLEGKNKKEIERLLLEQGLIKQKISSELTMSGFSWNEKNNFEKIDTKIIYSTIVELKDENIQKEEID